MPAKNKLRTSSGVAIKYPAEWQAALAARKSRIAAFHTAKATTKRAAKAKSEAEREEILEAAWAGRLAVVLARPRKSASVKKRYF